MNDNRDIGILISLPLFIQDIYQQKRNENIV
jgi:hypothetical protein